MVARGGAVVNSQRASAAFRESGCAALTAFDGSIENPARHATAPPTQVRPATTDTKNQGTPAMHISDIARRGAALAVACATFIAAPLATAATVLYYADEFSGTDYPSLALAARGDTVTTASSWADFNTKLGAGSYDLVIALAQDLGNGIDVPTLTSYVDGGGHVIFTDYTQPADIAALLDGSFTGTLNQTSANFAPALATGVTNPQPLTNPGWGTFAMSLAPGVGGTSVCSFAIDSCAVSGNGGRTLLLGFLADTTNSNGSQLWQNLIASLVGGAAPTPPAPIPTPTLSPWSLGALGLMLALVSARLARRRR